MPEGERELSGTLESALDFENAARFCNAHGAHTTTIDLCGIGLARYPGDALLHVYRAVAHDEFGCTAETVADCEAALRLAPPPRTAVYALTTLALAQERAGDQVAALAAVNRALGIAPADRDAHALLGTLRAWHGDYLAAWPELEYHAAEERRAFHERFPDLHEWNGEPIAGKRLLIAHAQGLGDLLQMIRYVPRVRERCAEIVLECAPALVPLLRGFPGIAEAVPSRTIPRARFDVYARAMTLPRLCAEDGRPGTSGVPYLRVEPARTARAAQRLGPRIANRRVGLVWAGNPQHPNDRRRSIPLAAFAALAGVPDAEWFSLQAGPHANDTPPSGLELVRLDDAMASMADTAAIVAQLDLVIAADTSVAHLAGALGVPVWLVLPWRPDWRWSPAAAETPWYPTMRLFHAAAPHWDGVIAAVAARAQRSPSRSFDT